MDLSKLVVIIMAYFCFILLCFYAPKDTKCTESQLHEVIQAVEMCKDANVICNEKMKDEIIKEICK